MSRNSKSNDGDKSKTKRSTRGRSSRKRDKKATKSKKLKKIETPEQVRELIRDNSLIISPLAQSNWFERCFNFEAVRMATTQMVHSYLFDPSTFNRLEDKDIISLYRELLKDAQFQKMSNMKIVEMKESSRLVMGLSKMYAEQEKRRALESNSGTHHVDTLLQQIIDESLRHAMNDELAKNYHGSNSYRPSENKNYEIVVKDENADE